MILIRGYLGVFYINTPIKSIKRHFRVMTCTPKTGPEFILDRVQKLRVDRRGKWVGNGISRSNPMGRISRSLDSIQKKHLNYFDKPLTF